LTALFFGLVLLAFGSFTANWQPLKASRAKRPSRAW